MSTVTISKRFSLTISDGLKAFLMAVLTPVFSVIADSVSRNSLHFDWHMIAVTAIGGAVGYLTKNWLTGPQVTMKVSPDTANDIEAGKADVKVLTK